MHAAVGKGVGQRRFGALDQMLVVRVAVVLGDTDRDRRIHRRPTAPDVFSLQRLVQLFDHPQAAGAATDLVCPASR